MMGLKVVLDGNKLMEKVENRMVRRGTEDKRVKLIHMARECVNRLKLGDWDVVCWPPDRITVGMMNILAASKQCSTIEGCIDAAREFSGFACLGNQVEQYVAKYLDLKDPETFFGATGTRDVRAACCDLLGDFLQNQDVRNIVTAVQETVRTTEGLVPLWTIPNLGKMPFPSWCDSVRSDYRHEWNSAVQELNRLHLMGPVSLPTSKSGLHGQILVAPGLLNPILICLDVMATAATAKKREMNILVATSSVGFHPEEYKKYFREFTSLHEKKGCISAAETLTRIRKQVAFQFLSSCLMRAYVSFLSKILQKNPRIGKYTNMKQLKKKHLFNKRESEESRDVWFAFESSFTSRIIGGDSPFPCSSRSIDYLRVMHDVIGGRVHKTSNIQVSIVDQLLGNEEQEAGTLVSKISRGHVRLLKCSMDSALVIPYLNTVILKLNDSRWLRDCDVQCRQPFQGEFNGGEIRRAANILLALKYPKEGKPFVDEVAMEILKKYAKKGELYSLELRNELLSVSRIDERVSIEALTASAHDVFGKDEVMVAAFVRELIHDRLLMKGDCLPSRYPDENDAYYDAVYRKRVYSVRNNVLWGPGVPLLGINYDEDAPCKTGEIQGHRFEGRKAKASGALNKNSVVFWFPEEFNDGGVDSLAPAYVTTRLSGNYDDDFPSAYIETAATVEEVDAITETSSSSSLECKSAKRSFGNVRVGGYCRVIQPERAYKSQAPKSKPISVDNHTGNAALSTQFWSSIKWLRDKF